MINIETKYKLSTESQLTFFEINSVRCKFIIIHICVHMWFYTHKHTHVHKELLKVRYGYIES